MNNTTPWLIFVITPVSLMIYTMAQIFTTLGGDEISVRKQEGNGFEHEQTIIARELRKKSGFEETITADFYLSGNTIVFHSSFDVTVVYGEQTCSVGIADKGWILLSDLQQKISLVFDDIYVPSFGTHGIYSCKGPQGKRLRVFAGSKELNHVDSLFRQGVKKDSVITIL